MEMKRKLLAAAIGGLFAVPGLAVAQAPTDGLQLYGGFDLSIPYWRISGAGATPEVSRFVLYNSGLRTIFGLRGQETLSRGLAVWFQAESTIFAEGRQNAPNQPAINFGGRNAGLGLRGGFGDVMVGQWDAPYKLNTYPTLIPTTLGFASGMGYGAITANAIGAGYGDTTGSVPNPSCQNLPTTGAPTPAQPICNQTEGSANIAWSRRLSDTLQYWSPVMGGFQFRIATQMNEAKSGTSGQDPRLWSTSLRWTGGPIVVGVAYELHQDFQFDGGKDNAVSLTAAYSFAPRTMVGAYVERINTDGPAAGLDVNARNWAVVGTLGVGSAGEVIASYAKAKDPSGSGVGAHPTLLPDAGGNAWSLGYRHHLSKRTNIYAVAARVTNDSGGTRTLGPVGTPNNSNGQPLGLSPGQDTTAAGLGMQTTF